MTALEPAILWYMKKQSVQHILYNYPTKEYLTFMARTSLQNQESPNQENNQLLEDLIQRLNSLEINIREVTHENQQLRRTNSSLESRLAIIERRVSESERQQPNQDNQQ